MNDRDIKYLELLAKNYPNVHATAAEIVRLQAILELPKTTEHFMSDIHGEYSYFTHILKNASGAIHSKIDDSFGDLLGEEEKNALALLLYYPERELAKKNHTESWYRVTIHRLVAVCRQATDKYTREKMRTRLPHEFSYLIEELVNSDEHDSNKRRYFESIINNVISTGIADGFIVAMANLISRLTVDRLHIVGDLFDRGPAAQMVMSELTRRHGVDFVWGNHDVLWMGAAMGNPACIANALRNSLKYGNFDTLEDGYGINVRPLAVFAVEQYGDDPCTYFQPTYVSDYCGDDSETTAKILKAITVIQFKLEGQLIRRHPEYGMDDRLLLHKVDPKTGTIETEGKTYHVNDCLMPTVDPEDPYRLSPAEENVVSQLIMSFRRSTLLQEHVDFLMEKGAMYRVCNDNLLYHGCVPMEPDGSFSQVRIGDGVYSGKALMDVCDRMARTANYDRRDELTDFMWYLWCGPCSPLNGKDKIATFERTFLTESEAGVETKNAYYTLWDKEGQRQVHQHRRRPVQGLSAGDRHLRLHPGVLLPRDVSGRAPAVRYREGGERQRGHDLPHHEDRAVPRPPLRARHRRRQGRAGPHRRSAAASGGVPQRPGPHAGPHGIIYLRTVINDTESIIDYCPFV